MTKTIVVRLPSERDLDGLARLCGQLGYPATSTEIQPRLQRIAADDRNVVFVAAESDGDVVGWIQVWVNRPSLIDDGGEAEIQGLVVDEARRGRGIGKILMWRAQEWALSQRCRHVRLRTNIIRHQAHRFYERLGYTKSKTSHLYERGSELAAS